jgi:hypothetical protein
MNREAMGFAEALISDGPSSSLGERANDLNWLVGSWSATVRDYNDDGTFEESQGEWWFSWILDGRALGDVWIVPPRSRRSAGKSIYSRYGCTIRVLDADRKTWHITWINAATGVKSHLSGCNEGGALVFKGQAGDDLIRWRFTEITDSSFRWLGERQSQNGDWILGSEFLLKRNSSEKSS